MEFLSSEVYGVRFVFIISSSSIFCCVFKSMQIIGWGLGEHNHWVKMTNFEVAAYLLDKGLKWCQGVVYLDESNRKMVKSRAKRISR